MVRVLILILISSCLMELCSASQFWHNNGSVFPANATLCHTYETVMARSKIDCGRQCIQRDSCLAYQLDPYDGQELNCFLCNMSCPIEPPAAPSLVLDNVWAITSPVSLADGMYFLMMSVKCD